MVSVFGEHLKKAIKFFKYFVASINQPGPPCWTNSYFMIDFGMFTVKVDTGIKNRHETRGLLADSGQSSSSTPHLKGHSIQFANEEDYLYWDVLCSL